MIKGYVKCECGQEFWFETIMPEIACIKCGRIFESTKHGEEVIEEVIEEPSYEEELAHDYDLDHDSIEEEGDGE